MRAARRKEFAQDEEKADEQELEESGWERGEFGGKERKCSTNVRSSLQKVRFVDILPNVPNCSLGRHAAGAWSAHYPSRSQGASSTLQGDLELQS